MKRIQFLYVLLFVLAMPLNGTAAGEKTHQKTIAMMPEVVVTATRSEQEVSKVPANVSVITSEDISNSTAKTVPDLLRYEEGIVVRDYYGNGKNVNVDLRGFGETGQYNTLVLVDGRRVNDMDLSGVDWTQIPLDQIDHIEIVRGTGTVLYGDNASGGVINIITKIPAQGLHASAGMELGSYQTKKGTASIEGGRDDIRGAINFSYQDTDGYRDNNDFRGSDIGGKIIYEPSEYIGLNLSGSYHNDDFGLPGPLTEAQVAQNRKQTQDQYYDDGQSSSGYLDLGMDWDLSGYGSIVMDLSYRKSDSEGMFRGTWPFLQKNDKKTWAFTPRYLLNNEILTHNNTFIGGIDIYTSDYHVDNFSGPALPQSGYADSDRRSIGIYFNDQFNIFDNLIFSFGGRYETVKYDLKQMDTSSGTLDGTVNEDEYAYNLGMIYRYQNKSSLFARMNRSFRFPLADEMVETVGTWPALSLQINSDLKPQTGMHYEVGARHYFTATTEVRMTFFRAEIKDEILLDKVAYPPFGENVNHPETLHQGIELGCSASPFKYLTIFGNYTYEKATFEKQPHKGNDIPAVPNHKGNAGISISDILPGLIFIVDYNYIGSSYAVSDLANQYSKLKSYYSIDTKLTYKFKIMNAYAGIKNLTNQKYSEYAIIGGTPSQVNYYPAPERNYFAGVEFVF